VTQSILLATLGTQPQVITLCLDKLLVDGYPISQVIVCHTNPASEPIHSSLSTLKREFQHERYQRLFFSPQSLVSDQGILDDIVSTSDIESAFHQLYTLVRQHKLSGNTIHMCVSGGRKTMTAFALAVAQIHFERTDFVWHLVSSAQLLASGTMHTNQLDQVSLIQVPVVYWQSFYSHTLSKAKTFISHNLTSAEQEVVTLLIEEGLSNKLLAHRLGKSTKTIANQLTSVFSKAKHYFNLEETPDRTTLMAILGKSS
jgi:CRISPR-associated protein Csx14